MREKLKRTLTNKTRYAILALLAVIMIFSFGMAGDAEAASQVCPADSITPTYNDYWDYAMEGVGCQGCETIPGTNPAIATHATTISGHPDSDDDQAKFQDQTTQWGDGTMAAETAGNKPKAEYQWQSGNKYKYNWSHVHYNVDPGTISDFRMVYYFYGKKLPIGNGTIVIMAYSSDDDTIDTGINLDGAGNPYVLYSYSPTTSSCSGLDDKGATVSVDYQEIDLTALMARLSAAGYTTVDLRINSLHDDDASAPQYQVLTQEIELAVTILSGDTLTASANTAIASANPTEGDNGILMQRFQLDSDAADSGTIDINSLTLQDDGNATSLNAYVYIDSTSSATLPGTATLLGQAIGWAGGSTPIALTPTTITNPTPQYIYIVYDVPSGQGGNTIQSNVTLVGVAAPDSGASAIGTSNALTVQATPKDTLTASANTAIASGSPASNVPPLLMQRFQVDSDNVLNGSVVLNSLGLQDDGNVTSITNAYVYIDDTSSATLPGTASLLGSTGAWDGTYKSIILSGDTTVSFGTSRFIYIVYDLDNGTSGSTIQPNVLDIGVVGPDLGATAIGTSNLLTIGACSEVTPSSLVWNANIVGNGDFNCSDFVTQTDITNLECQVTEGGGGGTVAVVGTPASGTGTAFPITITGATVPATADLCVVGVGWDDRNSNTVTSVVFNGTDSYTALTRYGTVASNAGAQLWYFINPTATTGDVVVSFSGTAPGKPFAAGITCFSGVDTGTPVDAAVGAAGTTDPATIDVTSAAGDMVVDVVVGYKSTDAVAGAGQTERWANGISGTEWIEGSTEPGAATVTMSWTGVSPSAVNAITAVNINAAAGETIMIPWNADPQEASGTLVDTNPYNLYARGDDPECLTKYYGDPAAANTTPDGTAHAITWNACTDTTPSNLVITVPALNNSTVGGPVTITATSDEQLSSGLPTVTVSGTTGGLCDVSAQNMTEAGTGPYTYTYSWSTALCGDPIENPITITVNGDDPECTVPQQAQWTNITIDNTCLNADTLSLVVADNITVPTAITATGTASNIQVQWQEDGGAWSGWVANGSVYTPTNQCSAGTVNFQAKGDDSNCGVDAHLVTDAGGTYQPFDDLATITITKPTSGGNVYGVYTVQAQIGVETTPNGMTSMQMTSVGSACDVTATAMGWEAINAGSNRWEANWDLSTCGSPEELGVTLDVSGVDPDCPGTINASQVTSLTVSTGPVFTITTCTDCHGSPPADSTGGRGTPAKSAVGSHSVAEHDATNCVLCHIDNGTSVSSYPQGLGHREGLIEMSGTIHNQAGSSYSKGISFDQIASASIANLGTCATTLCHGSSSPVWGTDLSGSGTCVKCHGEAGVASPTTNQAAPGSGGVGVDTSGNAGTESGGVSNDAQVGAHRAHLELPNALTTSANVNCGQCHVVPAAPSDSGHWDASSPWDGQATITFGTIATGSLEGAGTTPVWNGTTCNAAYCHNGTYFKNASGAGNNSTPNWTDGTYLTGTKTLAADCGQCHQAPPASVSAHSGITLISDCATCHTHFNTNGTLNTPADHINGTVEAASDCTQCHNTVQNGRDAVVGEFGLAWGHKKSGRGAVTMADCIVCHLEGDYATQSTSALHQDGNIDLRDPDGAGETPITNIAGGAWTFTKFATSYAAGSRTTTGHTLENVDNILTQKFCLACHDSNGATNTTARSTGGTAFMPWGGSTGYATADGAAAANGLIDVKTQVQASNISKHPITQPRSAGYPTTALMNAPYDNFTRSAGNLANSVVINCFDCHNSPTTLTTRTRVAHGSSAANAMRGNPTVATAGDSNPNSSTGATLCLVCHNPSTPGLTSHESGSGFNGGGRSPMDTFLNYGCNICHGNGYSAGQTPARPVRAQNVHGFSTAASGPVGTKRAFIRGNTADGYITQFSPGSCTGMGGSICAGARTKTYTPGGVY